MCFTAEAAPSDLAASTNAYTDKMYPKMPSVELCGRIIYRVTVISPNWRRSKVGFSRKLRGGEVFLTHGLKSMAA